MPQSSEPMMNTPPYAASTRPNSLLGWNAAITPYAVSAIAPSATNATPLCSLMPSHTR